MEEGIPVTARVPLFSPEQHLSLELKPPIRVCVTGAAGQIAYSLLPQIASGRMFGPKVPVILHLLDIPASMDMLRGVVMELEDCSFPLLQSIKPTCDVQEALANVDAAILVGAFPRKEGMMRKDLIFSNGRIFKEQGRALNKYASPRTKVLVVGNPANTNCYICRKYAPNIPAENFSALTRLDQNRAKIQCALKLHVPIQRVMNVIVWGNHSSTMYPDLTHASVLLDDDPARLNRVKLLEMLQDKDWILGSFEPIVQNRGAEIIKARKLSSAMSAASAICDHMRDWWYGTREGEWVSMAIPSDGSYNVPEGIVFSFPVSIDKDGNWKIVQGLDIDPESLTKIKISLEELVQEKETVDNLLLTEQN
eukprot:TRINITY_DN2493_c0_g1::TRINITY_DN2493_c0_g1_i1::g.9006::m.9006 TRINITY_DN2493_c0_g1::TRINITY_DN2493_c0_g1_i1::g.9006  ORF type:complete len:385 (+),score=128.53,sp/Q6PAB3/MDHC_XENLA/57.27/4e-125,Ldh_1_C/PF02866.13/1.1e-36,Ldh_1_N/PF00056.18/1.2e-33 TRINITY_DN2493_c0_g1_i1:63-1157(+)